MRARPTHSIRLFAPHVLKVLENRLFNFLLLILIPCAGFGLTSLNSWGDQSLFLRTLDEFSKTGTSSGITNNLMGPGYLFVVKFLSIGVGSNSTALIFTSIFSFAISYLCLIELVRRLKNQNDRLYGIALIYLSYPLLLVFIVKDVPWSHFPTIAIFLVIIALGTKKTLSLSDYLIIGALFALQFQIRSFEAEVTVLAFALTLIYKVRKEPKFLSLKRGFFYLSTACSFLLGIFFIDSYSGYKWLYHQYGNSQPSEDFSLINFFDRVVQLFWNPSFHALPDSKEFLWTNPLNLFSLLQNRQISLHQFWGMPILLSQPLLVPLIFAAFCSMVLAVRDGKSSLNVAESQIFLFITGSGILIGYLANPAMVGATLKYGIFREFLLPQFIFIVQLLLIRNLESWPHYRLKFFSFSLAALVLSSCIGFLPAPTSMNYQDFIFSATNENCFSNSRVCNFRVEVRNHDSFLPLKTQPIEVRALCGGQTQRWYEKSFRVDFNQHCKQKILKYKILPMSLGNSGTPEGEAEFMKMETVP
jgi:hypothetical protein